MKKIRLDHWKVTGNTLFVLPGEAGLAIGKKGQNIKSLFPNQKIKVQELDYKCLYKSKNALHSELERLKDAGIPIVVKRWQDRDMKQNNWVTEIWIPSDVDVVSAKKIAEGIENEGIVRVEYLGFPHFAITSDGVPVEKFGSEQLLDIAFKHWDIMTERVRDLTRQELVSACKRLEALKDTYNRDCRNWGSNSGSAANSLARVKKLENKISPLMKHLTDADLKKIKEEDEIGF